MTQLRQVIQGRSIDVSSGFPAARFYLAGIDDKLITNQPSNYRTYRFAIDIIQETTNKSKANAEADFEDAVDAVLDRLNANWSLGSNADHTVIEPSQVRETQLSFGPAAVLTILFSVKTLIY